MSPFLLLKRATSVAGIVLMTSGLPYAGDAISIASILISPQSFHRQAVMLHGAVKEIIGSQGWDTSNYQVLCSQQFILEDETGAIEVVHMARCQAGDEKVLQVSQGELLIISATIDAPPTNLKSAGGTGLGFRAMATKIIQAKK